MEEYKYQLVIAIPATTEAEFSNLLELEDDLEDALHEEEYAVVDGNDFGDGVFNLFLDTNEPYEAFDRVHAFLLSQRPGLTCTAGFRLFSEDEYTTLWPLGSTFVLH